MNPSFRVMKPTFLIGSSTPLKEPHGVLACRECEATIYIVEENFTPYQRAEATRPNGLVVTPLCFECAVERIRPLTFPRETHGAACLIIAVPAMQQRLYEALHPDGFNRTRPDGTRLTRGNR